CPRALEHYYLQLKDNFLDQWASRHSVSEERCWEMAALALKAEQYFPIWVIDVRGLEYVRKYMPAASEDLKDMSRVEAMMKFAFEASRSPFALNCHLYGLRRHKMDTVDNAVLGINAKGIEMCDIGDDGERIPLRSLAWNRVTRLSFDRKKLTIVGADTTKMCLYAQSESKASCVRAVHQTLLVLSHQNGKIAPLPQLFQEKSVDRVSTSSTNTTVPNNCDIEKDSDSLLRDSLSSSGDRGQGSVSSKQRVRIKLDSNLDLKIEKMELEHIRQERAASQSSKTSDTSDQVERKSDFCGKPILEKHHMTSSHILPRMQQIIVDSASQTVETSTRCAPVDVNFNLKSAINATDLDILEAYGIPYQGEIQYASSGGSRSDSVQHSNEMLPETMLHGCHHEQGCARSEDADSTLRSTFPQQSSVSLHDLRTAGIKPPPGYIDERTDNDGNVVVMPSLQWSTTDHQMQRLSASGQARSEPKIDSDLWGHPSVAVALLDSQITANGGRLFTKKSANGVINRVHSMPAHYHVVNGYHR
ncbi:FERM central domain protein, partial [Ostertagia ostertagi]